jgi:hypothetical protein
MYSSDEKEKLRNTLDASEALFEKNIVYLSAGALALSFGLIEKVVTVEKACCKVLLFISWSVLMISLSVNLMSHIISSSYTLKSIEEIDNELAYEQLIGRINKRNLWIQRMNWCSLITFLLGIVSLFIFVMLNI